MLVALILLPLLGLGCVDRLMTINSNPSGALVYLNGQEVGRTPMTREFTWYGKYDVVVRKDGYETLKTSAQVKAPIWQWIPLDLAADLLPFHFQDHQQLAFSLQPASTQPTEAHAILDRGEQLRQEVGPAPTTQPAD